MAASGTVIAALSYDSGVLIGADSQATDQLVGVRWTVTKLRQIRDYPFVLGFSGSIGAADRILDGLATTNIDWNALRSRGDLQRVLDEIPIPEYKAASGRPSGLPQGLDEIAIHGLAAVTVESRHRILEYEMSGDSGWHDYFQAIGSGRSTAYAIYRALGGRQLAGLRQDKALLVLLRIIRTAISVEPAGVSEPIVVWRLDDGGCHRFSDDEVNAQLQAVDEFELEERSRLFATDRER